jgi:hypothetical protein
LAVGLLFQNVVLVKQNRDLRMTLAPRSTLSSPLSHLIALNMDGARADIRPPVERGGKLVIITMSPFCPFCRASKAGWVALTTALMQKGKWNVVWVSRESVASTRRYCETNGIPLQNVFADATHQSYRELALDAVPNMVVVDHDGAVQRTWSGGLNPERSKQMSEYFGVPYGTFGAPGN